MTFEDIGVAVCRCGVERRLYKPESGPAACLPCIQATETSRRAREMSEQERGPCASAARMRERRAELHHRGLCIDCARMPHARDIKRCLRCQTKMLANRKAS